MPVPDGKPAPSGHYVRSARDIEKPRSGRCAGSLPGGLFREPAGRDPRNQGERAEVLPEDHRHLCHGDGLQRGRGNYPDLLRYCTECALRRFPEVSLSTNGCGMTSIITGQVLTTNGGSKTIKPGKALTLRVAFKPTSSGSKSANLRITSNDPDTPTIDILLSGTGQ
jgi:hypothetical protein